VPSSPPPSDSATRSDALREESTLLANARAAVRRGDSRSALSSLELARSRYPNGALVQEREVLTIEALAQSGDVDGASAHATRFLKAFPSSPHSAHVRTFVR
jgi:outer membrane protein assembly factor BamD (BamD/ComL family)